MRLVVYRHGEIQLPDAEKRFVGRTDYRLSDAGRGQMRRAAALYPGTPEAVYSSSSSRCTESGEIFRDILLKSGSGPELIIRSDLREIDMGTWEDQTFAAVKAREPGAFAARGRDLPNYRVPGGETFAEVQKRAVGAVRDIAAQTNSEAVLITHLGVIRTLRCYYYQLPLSRMMDWRLGYGEYLILESIL